MLLEKKHAAEQRTNQTSTCTIKTQRPTSNTIKKIRCAEKTYRMGGKESYHCGEGGGDGGGRSGECIEESRFAKRGSK